MRVCVMVEGQEGVAWEQWVALARACEDAGIEAMFRSDHYASLAGHADRGSLDAWTTIAALGAVTERLRFGTLVSPVTFRSPSLLARAVTTADHVSGGRVELGLGAGWHDGEHAAHGFPFPPMGERMAMLEEQLEIVVRQWTASEPFDFEGTHYHLTGSRPQPRPFQAPRPPVIVGGLAGPRSARLAAQWADEYNTVFADPADAAKRWGRIAEVCERHDRDPATLTYSMMTAVVIGETEAEVEARARSIMAFQGQDGSVAEWLDGLRGAGVVGTLDQAAERLAALEEAGVQRVMLQLQDHADVEQVGLIGELARRA